MYSETGPHSSWGVIFVALLVVAGVMVGTDRFDLDVGRDHLAVDAQLSDAARDELRVLRAVVEDDDLTPKTIHPNRHIEP